MVKLHPSTSTHPRVHRGTPSPQKKNNLEMSKTNAYLMLRKGLKRASPSSQLTRVHYVLDYSFNP